MPASCCVLLACSCLILSLLDQRATAVDTPNLIDDLAHAVDGDHATTKILVHSGALAGQLSLLSPNANMEKLAVTDKDVQFFGITVDDDTGDAYFATSNSAIRRARHSTMASIPWRVSTVIGGRVQVQVIGYYLGTSAGDIETFSIRGIECTNFRRESSNNLLCMSGHPTLTADLGKGISTDDIVVQTKTGGWTGGGYPGDFVEAKLAAHSLKPIITRVEASGTAINPRALCVDTVNDFLYYSDISTRSIQRITITGDVPADGDGVVAGVVEFETFLPNVGRVYGMAVDAEEGDDGGFLYFSDAESGTVSRLALTKPLEGQLRQQDTTAAAIQVLVTGVTEPMSIALEPGGGSRLFFTLYGGSIRAVSRNGYPSTPAPPWIEHFDGGGYEVRRFDSGTRLDGIAVAPSEKIQDDPTEQRLYWSESGRSPAIKRSSLDGTRVQSLLTVNSNSLPFGSDRDSFTRLVWPRGLALGTGASKGLLFCERFGGLWLLQNPGVDAEVEALVEEDAYPAAIAIKTLLGRGDKEGLKEKYVLS